MNPCDVYRILFLIGHIFWSHIWYKNAEHKDTNKPAIWYGWNVMWKNKLDINILGIFTMLLVICHETVSILFWRQSPESYIHSDPIKENTTDRGQMGNALILSLKKQPVNWRKNSSRTFISCSNLELRTVEKTGSTSGIIKSYPMRSEEK